MERRTARFVDIRRNSRDADWHSFRSSSVMKAARVRNFRPQVLEALRGKLALARRELLRELAAVESDLQVMEQTREIELEDRSQGEAVANVLARLKEREVCELREVQAALARITTGTYGICIDCDAPIAFERLRVVPSTALCTDCARACEGARTTESAKRRATRPVPVVPSELGAMDDSEISSLVRERFREQMDIALDRVRVVCRHGVVTLSGWIPSDELREIAIRIVEDEMGLEVVDRIVATRIPPLPERDRDALAGSESSEDIFEVEEQGIEYEPPLMPVPLKG